MDIIDIMLARAMTPQGKTEIYINKAEKAAEKAEQAKQDAAQAVATVEAAADEIAVVQEEAADLLAAAQEALETAQQATINMPEVYNTTGQNTDGYMTQKAVTDALATKADTSALNIYVTNTTLNTILSGKADKTYVDQQIANIPSGGGSGTIHFSTNDAGKMVVIDENGNIIASNITEEQLLAAVSGSSSIITAKDAIGLDMDYANKTFTRIQKSSNLTMGQDFDKFAMYGGRMRCNVADDGTINAFYGESGYRDDGSNGQVMVYQPKFYYKRIPYDVEEISSGKIIRHEALILSPIEQLGFKLAPAFYDGNEYVLLGAYNGSLVNDKLASIAGAEPITNISIIQAEAYAHERGEGWHILNMEGLATNQMLEIVEFGMMNGQSALELGIVNNPASDGTYTYINGSTALLGNTTGHAEETQVNINNSISTQTAIGKRAISYRGMENPWGNLWQMVGGINIYGDGYSNSGTPYICTDFDYDTSAINSNYESVGFNLPAAYKWQNAMGLGNTKYDWVFLPIECSNNANSLLPIGDSIWFTSNLRGINVLAVGGSCGFKEECGPFYYAVDRKVGDSARNNYNARLMYIPTKNNIYNANITKWSNRVGG